MAIGPYINMKRHSIKVISGPHSSAHTPALKPHSFRTTSTKRLLILALLSLILYLLTFPTPIGIITNTSIVLELPTWNATRAPSESRIAKATILYDDHSIEILVRALNLHEAHGYEVHVLRKQIVKGYADQWLWLHEVIVKELRRKSEERAEWVV